MAKKAERASDSSLPPAPGDLPAKAAIKAATNGNKRIAEPAVKVTVMTTTRTGKVLTDEVKEEDELAVEVAERPRKKRAISKNVKYKEHIDDEVEGVDSEQATVIGKTVKKKAARAKKSKEPVPPLEERTVDTKLRIGAHVSIAGG